MKALAKRYADDGIGWADKVREFYGELTSEMSERCYLSAETAQAYAGEWCAEMLAGGIALVDGWEPSKIITLQGLMLED